MPGLQPVFLLNRGAASLAPISTSSSVTDLGTGLLPARADPDHGWKSDVGCDAAF